LRVAEDLVHESSPQALTGHLSAEDFEVLPAHGVQYRGDRLESADRRCGAE
jgi:hypothetical protein